MTRDGTHLTTLAALLFLATFGLGFRFTLTLTFRFRWRTTHHWFHLLTRIARFHLLTRVARITVRWLSRKIDESSVGRREDKSVRVSGHCDRLIVDLRSELDSKRIRDRISENEECRSARFLIELRTDQGTRRSRCNFERIGNEWRRIERTTNKQGRWTVSGAILEFQANAVRHGFVGIRKYFTEFIRFMILEAIEFDAEQAVTIVPGVNQMKRGVDVREVLM